jgi:hypothetical protein
MMSITDTMFDDLLSRDVKGHVCITEENLDRIWPRDDREPEVIVGKWFDLPPTCGEVLASCEDRFGRQYCLEFAFGGGPLPDPPSAVPLPSGAVFLTTALIAALAIRKLKRTNHGL